ncbi:MAG: 4a-hydroxytetrahydrobiopterin dehydratase [Coleofasciculaceae cyanobacterium RL_1_1]|nr:4a-hydroxytetrahydrobiopterin dehydratase [Coleofasciculaceae cyanobacterium RL_1_1]
MSLLSPAEIQMQLGVLPGWVVVGDRLERQFIFNDFVAAIDFVNRLVEPAERAAHHPDLRISYNKVTVQLTTHDAGGLTAKDFALAKVVSGFKLPGQSN